MQGTGLQIDDAAEDGAQLEEMVDETYDRYITQEDGEVKQERKRGKRIDPGADAVSSDVSC